MKTPPRHLKPSQSRTGASQELYAQKNMTLVSLAAASFAAMMLNDLFLTCMVVFESHYNAWMAGVCDVIGWGTGLMCTYLAIDSIIKNGLRNRRSVVIILAVSAANMAGTFAGVDIARALG